MIEYGNVFYVANFNIIGGVETFIYELARKYSDYDITVIYKTGYSNQINRLKKYVRVKKYNGEKIKCKKAFFNYETDIIDNIEADEYIQLIHAMFKTQGITPRPNSKITKYLGVSKAASKEWEELTGIKCEYCRNPLSITKEERKPTLYLISATRLTAEKGKNRMIILADLLDKANQPYLWLVFTNDKDAIDNPNVVYMKPRLDIRPFIASIKGRGYGVQLSDCEGDCYFTRECEGLGVPLLVTPIPSFKEQGLVDGENCYYLPFDMSNIDVEKIMNNIPQYDAYIKEDSWNKMLNNKKSTYQEELNKRYLVEALPIYTEKEISDNELERIPHIGEQWIVSGERLDVLLGENEHNRVFVKVIKEVPQKQKLVGKKGRKNNESKSIEGLSR